MSNQEDIEMKDETSNPKINNNNNNPIINNPKKSKLPFIEKYRPNQISEIISHEEILKTINTFIQNKSIPHFLFYGPPGTGKTTCALALSKQLYGDSYRSMTLELNASDERGINIVRQKIKDFCGAIGTFSMNIIKSNNNNINNNNNGNNNNNNNNYNNIFKLVILDEADMMTNDAQNALRRIMEKYTKNSRFILICNQVNKIHIALQSRCMKFRFNPLKKEQCIKRIKEICEYENINYNNNDNILYKIIEIGKGDMRKILNLLEATNMSSQNNNINEDMVYLSAGLPTKSQFNEILNKAKNNNENEKFGNIFKSINDMRIENGFSMVDLLNELCNFVRENKKMNEYQKIECFKLMEKLDFLCNIGGNEKIVLSNFVSLIRRFDIS